MRRRVVFDAHYLTCVRSVAFVVFLRALFADLRMMKRGKPTCWIEALVLAWATTMDISVAAGKSVK